MRLSPPPRPRPRPGRVFGVTEDLVAQFAGIAGARDDDRDAVVVADPPDREIEPLDLVDPGAAPARSR